VVLTTTAANQATTTTLQANPQATTGGALVTFTATVAPTPTGGTVNFLDANGNQTLAANVAVVNGQAVFSTSTLSVGVHPVTAAYSGTAGFAPSTSSAVNVTISAANPPALASTPGINAAGGTLVGFQGDQRSRVISATVVFNQAVQMDAGAIALALHTNNVSYGGAAMPTGYGTIPANLNFASTDNITWTVTWSGTGTVEDELDGFHSLKDGVYDLNVDASKVHPQGNAGVSGSGITTTAFHRLFGDTNLPETPAGGTAGVDFSAVINTGDNFVFRNAFNKPVGGGYLPYMDFDGSQTINTGDNFELRNRFNKALVWRV
jgi:hypothetical protein